MGILRTLELLQRKGFSEAPLQLSCTDLQQQWRDPRGERIRGTSIQSVDWRSVREGGLETPTTSRLYESRATPRSQSEQDAATKNFAQAMTDLDGTTEFGRSLLGGTGQVFVKTKFGISSVLAPQAYQQAKLPFGFKVLTNIHFKNAPTDPPPLHEYEFFRDAEPWAVPSCFEGHKILEVTHIRMAKVNANV
ncbi:hypothetical protein HPB47_013535 [Ixodes persulcatus]|uniref:Uncharacterized protein n=1 Tax=Ixodes persulcatus TaxID=34615 RepID=A0AC60QZ90_IXOPE|nr:hypothetical protein HPB47_013535 [Ixodes persulcatus]